MNLEPFSWESVRVSDILCDRDLTEFWVVVEKTDSTISLLCLQSRMFPETKVVEYNKPKPIDWQATYIALDARV